MPQRTEAAAADAAADGRPRARTSYLIGRLDRALRRHINEAVRPLGLTTQQYTALSVLNVKGQLSNARLAQHSFISPQAANEMVKALETKGLVTRKQNPAHGRIIWIMLTDQGRQMLAECESAVDRLEHIMLQDLSADERRDLAVCLKACARALGSGSAEF